MLFNKKNFKQPDPLKLHLNKLLNSVYSQNDNGVFIKLLQNWENITPKNWQEYVTPVDIKWQKNQANLVVKVKNKSLSGLLFHEKDAVLEKLNQTFYNTCYFEKITII